MFDFQLNSYFGQSSSGCCSWPKFFMGTWLTLSGFLYVRWLLASTIYEKNHMTGEKLNIFWSTIQDMTKCIWIPDCSSVDVWINHTINLAYLVRKRCWWNLAWYTKTIVKFVHVNLQDNIAKIKSVDLLFQIVRKNTIFALRVICG